MKSLRPKKLSFDEMWKLYKIIKADKTEELAINEINAILDRITNDQFLECLNIMKFPESENRNSLKVAIYFTSTLLRNKVFDFGLFIRGLNGSTE